VNYKMTNLAQDTSNSAKNLAQQLARQIAREPSEILKDIREQTTGQELSGQPDRQQSNAAENQNRPVEHQGELQDKMKSGRRMEALNRELDDIHKQEKFSELQKIISEGVEVSLEEYPDLSMEQKQVLKAQMEAVKNQIEAQQAQDKNVLIEPASHKGRQLFNFGKKQSMKQEQTRVEKPVPPSG
jgi:hypothetical protein